MSSEQQKAANQANAQKSTGPKTEAGKAVSRHNAMTHGLTGEILLHYGESPDAYEKLRRDYFQEFAPAGPYETEMVERLVSIDWRLRRILNFETALVEAAGYRLDLANFAPQERPVILQGRGLGEVLDHDHFQKLGRYERRLIRLRQQTFGELEALWEGSGRPRRPLPVTIDHDEGPSALVKIKE